MVRHRAVRRDRWRVGLLVDEALDQKVSAALMRLVKRFPTSLVLSLAVISTKIGVVDNIAIAPNNARLLGQQLPGAKAKVMCEILSNAR
jgi:hypothetical protein